MTLCVFALIASEFMPVSLLTPIASDLHVSEGLAGQGIAVSGAFARADEPVHFGARRQDQPQDAAAVAVGLDVRLRQNGRAGAQLCDVHGGACADRRGVGGFWSLSAATAMRLVPARQVPRALAIFNGGNALATVVAAPLGSYLGALIGWRGAFFCLVPVALRRLSGVGQPARHAGRTTQAGSGNVCAC